MEQIRTEYRSCTNSGVFGHMHMFISPLSWLPVCIYSVGRLSGSGTCVRKKAFTYMIHTIFYYILQRVLTVFSYRPDR